MTAKEFRYPPGHNWEGLTPDEVNKGYAKYKETLSDKIEESNIPSQGFIWSGHVKEKIQNVQRRLKEELDNIDNAKTYDKGNGIIFKDFVKEAINKIFKEEFGEKLIKNE